MTRATVLLLSLAASPVFWLGVSAGLAIAAVVLACTVLVDAVRERRARRAARYTGRRRKSRALIRAVPDIRASKAGDTAPLPVVRLPSPHGSARPVPPWAGRSERPGLMARLGGWHR